MNATSLEHKLTVIKQSVTAAGHAAVRPLLLLLEPLACVAWPGGSPAGPAPCRAAAPAGRDQSCASEPGPGHNALQRREPSAGQRPPAEPAELGRPRISPSCRVGQPARGPGCCHSRGFRLGPEARAPRPAPPLPERSASRGDVRAPPPAARLLGRAANSSSWDTGVGCGGVWSVCPSRWRPPGSGRCTSLRPFPGASLATLISPSLLAAESTAAAGRSPTPPSRLCTAPGSPLECPSRWSSCLPAPQSGLPGIVGTRLAPGPLAWTRAQTDNGGAPEDGVRWLLVAVGVRGAPRALGF